MSVEAPTSVRTAAAGDRSSLVAFFGFGLAAVAVTWPLAVSPGQAVSIRGDYYVHVWNIWWLKTALFELGTSPFHTEMLHSPLGVSLGHHTLSIANALVGALSSFVLDIDSTLRALLLLHFWLSGWTFFLFAREMSGNVAGAALAGLLFTSSPYHAYYLAQLNLATLEFIPLVAFFVVRAYRRGGAGNSLGIVLSAALLVASDFYYLVYAAVLCGLLVACGRILSPEVPWRAGLCRLAPAAVAAGCAVVAIAWPLLTDPAASASGSSEGLAHVAARSSDLLGFKWRGYPEVNLVSWPTLLGYTTILLLVVGHRRIGREWLWLVLMAGFFLWSLGPELRVNGEATGVPLPYRLLAELPILANLRKPQRLVVMMVFCAALLLAHAWGDIASRLRDRRLRGAAWAAAAALLVVELAPAPLEMHTPERQPVFEALGRDEADLSLVDLPTYGGRSADARTNRDQTVHGKRMAQGYVTSLALGDRHHELGELWHSADRALSAGDATPIAKLCEQLGIDLVVLRKSKVEKRPHRYLHGAVVWQPFRLVREELVPVRQRGHLEEVDLQPEQLRRRIAALTAAVGPSLLEDSSVAVFRVSGASPR